MDRGLYRLYLNQLFVTSIGFVVFFFLNKVALLPFLAGSGVITLNFYFLVKMWKLVFEKKAIALTGGLIITKYTALGVLLYVFVQRWSGLLLPLLAGLTTVFVSLIIFGFQIYFSQMKLEKNK